MSDATAAQGADPPQRARRGDLIRRLLAALPLAAIALGAAYLGGPAFYVVVAVVGLLMAREWARMAYRRSRNQVANVAIVAAGFLLLFVLAAATCWLRGGLEEGRATMFWLFVVVWSTDSAAYLVGRALRGPRLAPRISPKKTWSGAVGGLVCALLVAIGMGEGVYAAGWLSDAPSTVRVALAGLGVGLLAILGDLFESWIKRRYGVKDSGALIPGHGGFLDRLDSFSAAALGLAVALGAAGANLVWSP
ncbi:MAG: phosphatidate cytidylyltransferase [Alphaproteobacteria bacterium]|nr:phosphatidate cytidylyltransferase [Alphaproteobacteria bacterium]